MKRKLVTVFLTLIAALCLCFALVACDSGNSTGGNGATTEQGGNGGTTKPEEGSTTKPDGHVHSFTNYVYNNDATCTEDGTETATCTCGVSDTRPKAGTATGHSYTVDNICSECGDQWKFTEGLTYELDSYTNTYIVTGRGTATDKDIVIPYGYRGIYVTKIGDEALSSQDFSQRDWIESVVIPDSVTSIGYSAFSGCSSIQSITIPFVGESRKTSQDTYQYPFGYIFGTSQFDGASAVEQRYYGSRTSSATRSTYYIPLSLKNVTVTGGEILYGAFSYCSGLTSVTIGSGVTSIGDDAFEYCSELKSVIWNAENCTSAGSFGSPIFSVCKNLSSVTFGENVKTIPAYAFQGCSGLTSVTIGSGVTSIGDYAFRDCSGLESVTIGSGVTSIGWDAFEDCSGLISIEIPDNVTSIGYEAFKNCSRLSNIVIPDSVTSIGGYAFSDTAYSKDQSHWDESGVLYIGNHLIEAKDTISGSYTIRANTKTIADDAFDGCKSLTGIEIPDSVTSIGSDAFWGCSGLKSVTIGSGVTSIESFAFMGCSGLKSVTIGSGVTSIGVGAFRGCSGLTGELKIPANVTSIGVGAFSDCSGLESVTIGNGVTWIGDGAFENCSGLTGDLKIPDNVTSIGSEAFKNCSRLSSIEIPDSVTSIGQYAFAGTAYYKDQSHWDESGVLYIGNHLLEAKDTISGSYTIRANTKTIAGDAFDGCKSLTGIEIPDSVTSIEGYAFYNCSGLTNIEIPDSVNSIEYGAFWDCSGLTSVTIGSGVTSIGLIAFYYCSGLQSVTIGSGVTSIEYGAFDGCDRLENVYYKGTSSEWSGIKIDSDNYNLTEATRYYFSAQTPSAEQWQESENWWHYDLDTNELTPWVKENQ